MNKAKEIVMSEKSNKIKSKKNNVENFLVFYIIIHTFIHISTFIFLFIEKNKKNVP